MFDRQDYRKIGKRLDMRHPMFKKQPQDQAKCLTTQKVSCVLKVRAQAPVKLKLIWFKVGSIASLLDAFKDSYKKKLRVSPQVFHAIDLNGSGVLGKGEFRSYMLLREGKAGGSASQRVFLLVAVGSQPGKRAFSPRASRYTVTLVRAALLHCRAHTHFAFGFPCISFCIFSLISLI